MLRSVNPYTGKEVSLLPELTDDELFQKLECAKRSFLRWKLVGVKRRVELLINLAKQLLLERAYLARLITTEMGKPIRESLAEIDKCAWVCQYYAENAEDFLKEEKIETDAYNSYVRYDPLGVILGIMPWNFPFWQVFRFLAPNIVAGNVLLLKHASNVQQCANAIELLVQKANFPENTFQNLSIPSSKVEGVIAHDYVKGITLTGSEAAGAAVSEIAGRNIKKTVLELGGSNAFIVTAHADVKIAVEAGVLARMMNAGQSCIAAKRFLVHQSLYALFVRQFVERVALLKVGNPELETVDIGPLSSIEAALEVEEQVRQSVELGAKILIGGSRTRATYKPTVLTNVNTKMPVMREEVFGPVAPIMSFSNIKEAIKHANETSYGLGVSIFSQNLQEAQNLTADFDDGAVFINSLVKSDPRLPFGGTKNSGYGRELSLHGIREFVNVKTVYVQKL